MVEILLASFFFFSSRRRHTRFDCDWSSDVCSSDLTYLDDFWAHADVELEGDPEIQQAVRFATFHVLQAGARAEGRPIPAKGLTGTGYDGHAFWDTEIFVLPVLALTLPRAAADALRWRHLILDKARDYARQYGLRGAAFPWRTIRGAESSGYWPAGTAAFHINADVAYAVANYIVATGRSEEHTSELQSQSNLVCRLLLEKKK